MFVRLTRGDKVLFVFLFLLTIYIFKIAYSGVRKGSMVVINASNKEFGKFPLKGDRHIYVNGPLGTTDVEIKDGKVGIVNSPCPNKVCVRFGYINQIGRVSVCLPNRVVIRIIGGEDPYLDAVIG